MAKTALRRGSQEEGNSEYFTGCPIGGGFMWFGLPTKIPANCKICDNSTLAIADYAKLNENLGGAWGTSGGNLNIPDLRGRFPRGVDGGVGNDPDRATRTAPNAGGNAGDAVGTVQDSAQQRVTGSAAGFRAAFDTVAGAFALSPFTNNYGTGTGGSSGRVVFDNATVARTSTEDRPRNANVYFVIRVS
jgi:microcystin-dependent protein